MLRCAMLCCAAVCRVSQDGEQLLVADRGAAPRRLFLLPNHALPPFITTYRYVKQYIASAKRTLLSNRYLRQVSWRRFLNYPDGTAR